MPIYSTMKWPYCKSAKNGVLSFLQIPSTIRNIYIVLLIVIDENTCLELDLGNIVWNWKLGDMLVFQGMNVNVNYHNATFSSAAQLIIDCVVLIKMFSWSNLAVYFQPKYTNYSQILHTYKLLKLHYSAKQL